MLGVGIVGHGAGELIGRCGRKEMGPHGGGLAGVVHPHPTRPETLMESAEAFSRAMRRNVFAQPGMRGVRADVLIFP